MHRQQVTSEEIAQETLVLAGPAAHHLLHVLRVREGDEVGAFDGAGATRLYHVAERAPDALTLVAKQPLFHQDVRPIRLTLFVCVPKGERMEWLLEKATELGVDRIVPVLSARTVVRLDARQARAKQERWLRIVQAAARQCGAARLPELLPPTPIAETAPLMRACSTLIVAALTPQAKPLFPVLDALDASAPGQEWGWWCGPEGDFTPDELRFILDHSAIPVTLGPLILRVETAALYGLANLGCRREGAGATRTLPENGKRKTENGVRDERATSQSTSES